MNLIDKTFWGIHAGRSGEVESLFVKRKIAALGWAKIGDLSGLNTREEFKARYAEAFPDQKPGSVPVSAGQLFRFIHEMKIGDYIVLPCKLERQIWVGEVTGEYEYQPAYNQHYPHHRAVKWLKTFPRTDFSQGALYEIGSAMTFFQVKNYADEFLSLLEGQQPEVVQDISVGMVAEEIEEQTADFILKQLERNLKGLPFEEFVQHLLQKMGYHARLTKRNEPSVDLIAHKDELGFEPPIIKVQVKSSPGKISDRDVSALIGKLQAGEFGLLITLGEFTPEAKRTESAQCKLRLINGKELVELVLQYYEIFDPEYKSIIPMKRVYIPQVFEGD